MTCMNIGEGNRKFKQKAREGELLKADNIHLPDINVNFDQLLSCIVVNIFECRKMPQGVAIKKKKL